MTGAELRERREALGLSAQAMHDALMDTLGQPRSEHGRSIMSRWEADRVSLPVWMPLVLALMALRRDQRHD